MSLLENEGEFESRLPESEVSLADQPGDGGQRSRGCYKAGMLVHHDASSMYRRDLLSGLPRVPLSLQLLFSLISLSSTFHCCSWKSHSRQRSVFLSAVNEAAGLMRPGRGGGGRPALSLVFGNRAEPPEEPDGREPEEHIPSHSPSVT